MPSSKKLNRYWVNRAHTLPRKELGTPINYPPTGAYDKQYHTEMGVHSRIPECCIEYWNSGAEDRATKRMSKEEYLRWAENRRKEPWSYAPCPTCRSEMRVKTIHMCANDCPGLRDIFRRATNRYKRRIARRRKIV